MNQDEAFGGGIRKRSRYGIVYCQSVLGGGGSTVIDNIHREGVKGSCRGPAKGGGINSVSQG